MGRRHPHGLGLGANQVLGNVIRNTGRGGIFGAQSTDLVIRHNRVTGSGGPGLGIEIWGGCPRSLIEDNTVDHWISVDKLPVGGAPQCGRRRRRHAEVSGNRDYRPRICGDRQRRQAGRSRRPVGLQQARQEQRLLGLHRCGIAWCGPRSFRVKAGASPTTTLSLQLGEHGAGRPACAVRSQRPRLSHQRVCRGLTFERCSSRTTPDRPATGRQGRGCLRTSSVNHHPQRSGSGRRTARLFRPATERLYGAGNKSDQLPAAKPFAGAVPTADFVLPAEVRRSACRLSLHFPRGVR